MKPESHLMQERRLLENHIQAFFGRFETILHETSFPGISTDICVIPPSGDRNYHTLVSLGEYSTSSAQTQEQGKMTASCFCCSSPQTGIPMMTAKNSAGPFSC